MDEHSHEEGNDAASAFAMSAIEATVEFVKESKMEPSTMLAALGSIFWTYLMMISPPHAAADNIDSAMKFMAASADHARMSVHEIEWAEISTHDQVGNA